MTFESFECEREREREKLVPRANSFLSSSRSCVSLSLVLLLPLSLSSRSSSRLVRQAKSSAYTSRLNSPLRFPRTPASCTSSLLLFAFELSGFFSFCPRTLELAADIYTEIERRSKRTPWRSNGGNRYLGIIGELVSFSSRLSGSAFLLRFKRSEIVNKGQMI